MPIFIDFRLLELSMDLGTLERHFSRIEEEIARGEETANQELKDKWQALEFKDEAEWDLLRQERDFQLEFVLPRVLRCPFLVTLFTVYETAVTEIAKHIQDKRGLRISFDDLRGGLLSRARKYYANVLDFELSKSNRHWERITLLSDLRNAIAHRNGRLDLMSPGVGEKLLKIDGVSESFGYIVVDENFLRETFTLVKEELEGLVARYKQWDTEHRAWLQAEG
ncbi:MAG: hypothetical protein OXI91_15305 [Chloroflexota bacterium]|nr:hypothetical protein [Chloroflexota bacterium]